MNRCTAGLPTRALICAIFFVCTTSQVRAAGVVGTGTAASCTDAALNVALANSGELVTFNCGPAPMTIDISTGTGTKTIFADTTIDGGGLITISGEGGLGLVNGPPTACPHGIAGSARVDIALIIQAVNHALTVCGGG